MDIIKKNQRKVYLKLKYIETTSGISRILSGGACRDRFPESIMVKFSMRDTSDVSTYREISEACKKYAVDQKVTVYFDEPRWYKTRKLKSCTADRVNREDLYIKRLELYNSLRNDLDHIEKMRKSGYTIDVTLPETKYKMEELLDVNVETVSMCTITVFADVSSDFYRDFYVKGLMEKYSPRQVCVTSKPSVTDCQCASSKVDKEDEVKPSS
jgi:hypothetical protein